jgi:glycine/D-amino acid oxidase-like deaminating enzyme
MSIQSDARPSESSAPADRVYDVIVLGAGPVGQTVAARTRSAGLAVVLVERELVGGECSYWGCVQAKRCYAPSWRLRVLVASTACVRPSVTRSTSQVCSVDATGMSRTGTTWVRRTRSPKWVSSSFAGMPGSTAPDEYESSQPTNASTSSPHAMRW